MHILNFIKDNLKDVKLSFIKYLTPVEYIEFTIKMLLVLDKAKVELCLWISTGMLVLILIANSIFPIALKNRNIVIAIVFSILLNLVFSSFRKSKVGKTDLDYEIKDVKIKEQEIDLSVNLPDNLKKYFKE